MTLQEYIDLNIKKGTIHSIHYRRIVKTIKEFENRVEKETIGNFRIGCSYRKTDSTKKHYGMVGSLPYGMWVYSNEIIYSITKKGEESFQLRLTTTHNKRVKPKVNYYLDGKKITKQELIELGAIKEEEPSQPLEIFNVKLNNIIKIK